MSDARPETYDETNARLARRLVAPILLRQPPQQQPSANDRPRFVFANQAAEVLETRVQAMETSRVRTANLIAAGVVPTYAEMQSALASSYSSSNPPIAGDIVHVLENGTGALKFRATIRTSGTTPLGIFYPSFTVSGITGVTFYALVEQLGLY